ncbi:MAG: RNA polymerase sigma factor [Alphaproteobacteria bacterium]
MTTGRDKTEEERRRPGGPAAGDGTASAHDPEGLNGAKALNGTAANGTAGLNGAQGLNGSAGLNGTGALNGTKPLNGAEALNGAPAANIVIEDWARRYGEPLRRFFVKRGASSAEAEDLTQEVYVRITRMDGVDGIREPEAFLFQTAANLLRDNARRSQTRRTRDHVSVDDSRLAAGTAGPDRVLEGKQSLEGVLNVLKALTTRQRNVFILHRFEGMTYSGIAEHLGISTSAVEKHMMKAISRLHQHLEDR